MLAGSSRPAWQSGLVEPRCECRQSSCLPWPPRQNTKAIPSKHLHIYLNRRAFARAAFFGLRQHFLAQARWVSTERVQDQLQQEINTSIKLEFSWRGFLSQGNT